jgi:ABC-type amino acid transport substrate-binding protein
MAQILAREMKVKLEFVPFDFKKMAAQLDAGLFDLIMAGIVVTTPRLEKMTFSAPYMEGTLCFIVRGYRRAEFATNEALPQVDAVQVDSIEEYFTTNKNQLDALLMEAEGGSAWTLRYPKFKVVVPKPAVSKVPIAYAVSRRNPEFAGFLSQWANLKRDSLEYPMLYDHWILGLDAEPKHPRWSIIRNVLGWVK